jgi:hypothetical protein
MRTGLIRFGGLAAVVSGALHVVAELLELPDGLPLVVRGSTHGLGSGLVTLAVATRCGHLGIPLSGVLGRDSGGSKLDCGGLWRVPGGRTKDRASYKGALRESQRVYEVEYLAVTLAQRTERATGIAYLAGGVLPRPDNAPVFGLVDGTLSVRPFLGHLSSTH